MYALYYTIYIPEGMRERIISFNFLNAEITTVGMFSKMTFLDIVSSRNFGKKSLEELQSKTKNLIDYFNLIGEDSLIASIS